MNRTSLRQLLAVVGYAMMLNALSSLLAIGSIGSVGAVGSLTLAPFTAGMTLSLSLIVAIGPQNAHLLRMGWWGWHNSDSYLRSFMVHCLTPPF